MKGSKAALRQEAGKCWGRPKAENPKRQHLGGSQMSSPRGKWGPEAAR